MTLFEEIYGGACLFCGGLAQGMSDEAAIRYAAFWSGWPASRIAEWVGIAYPDGTEQERTWQSGVLRSRAEDIDTITNIIDDYVKRNGFTSEGRQTMYAGALLYLYEKYGRLYTLLRRCDVVQDQGQAGAEIEITPAMVEAACKVVLEEPTWDREHGFSLHDIRQMMPRILAAAIHNSL